MMTVRVPPFTEVSRSHYEGYDWNECQECKERATRWIKLLELKIDDWWIEDDEHHVLVYPIWNYGFCDKHGIHEVVEILRMDGKFDMFVLDPDAPEPRGYDATPE